MALSWESPREGTHAGAFVTVVAGEDRTIRRAAALHRSRCARLASAPLWGTSGGVLGIPPGRCIGRHYSASALGLQLRYRAHKVEFVIAHFFTNWYSLLAHLFTKSGTVPAVCNWREQRLEL